MFPILRTILAVVLLAVMVKTRTIICCSLTYMCLTSLKSHFWCHEHIAKIRRIWNPAFKHVGQYLLLAEWSPFIQSEKGRLVNGTIIMPFRMEHGFLSSPLKPFHKRVKPISTIEFIICVTIDFSVYYLLGNVSIVML